MQGFEYWDVSAWDNCLKPMKGKKYVDQVESPWSARSFGDYNGDGYLFYPGPNATLLSSIRFEALRDGFEDYEYLAILKGRAAGQSGPAAEAGRGSLRYPTASAARTWASPATPSSSSITAAVSPRPSRSSRLLARNGP